MLSILCCGLSITTALAQNYKSIEWDVLGINYLIPVTNTTGTAVGFYTEARYNANNKLSIGLKYNWQFFNDIFDEPLRGMGITKSVGLTGDYYLSNNLNNRAFVGLGIGSFNNAATTEIGTDVGGNGLGITPRIGYELDFLRLTIEYNQTLKDDFPDYFALGLGLTIGGRHK